MKGTPTYWLGDSITGDEHELTVVALIRQVSSSIITQTEPRLVLSEKVTLLELRRQNAVLQ